MKTIILILGVAAVSLGLSACSKCAVCSKLNKPDVRVCQSDYSSENAYTQAIDAYESQDYSCSN